MNKKKSFSFKIIEIKKTINISLMVSLLIVCVLFISGFGNPKTIMTHTYNSTLYSEGLVAVTNSNEDALEYTDVFDYQGEPYDEADFINSDENTNKSNSLFSKLFSEDVLHSEGGGWLIMYFIIFVLMVFSVIVFALTCGAVYVLMGIFLTKLNKLIYGKGTPLAWIPFANCYLLGKLVFNRIVGYCLLIFFTLSFVMNIIPNFRDSLLMFYLFIFNAIVCTFMFVCMFVKYFKTKKERQYISNDKSLSTDNRKKKN